MCCSFWTWAHVVYPHETVKLVLYLLECQVFQRIHCECSGSLRVMGGGGSHSSPKEVFLSLLVKITTMKSVLCWNKSRVEIFFSTREWGGRTFESSFFFLT